MVIGQSKKCSRKRKFMVRTYVTVQLCHCDKSLAHLAFFQDAVLLTLNDFFLRQSSDFALHLCPSLRLDSKVNSFRYVYELDRSH